MSNKLAPIYICRHGHLYVRLPKSILEGAKVEMVIDPNIQSGAPVIKGTRVTLETLAVRVLSGESIAAVAATYRVSEDAVREAVEYVNASPETIFGGWRLCRKCERPVLDREQTCPFCKERR